MHRASVLVALLGAGVARPAVAGNAVFLGIPAATPDGIHVAYFESDDGSVRSCGLAKAQPRSRTTGLVPIVPAGCVDAERRLVPFEKWTWERRVPEIDDLRAFGEKGTSAASVLCDPETLLCRLQIRIGEQWKVIRPVGSQREQDGPAVPQPDGLIRIPGAHLVRMSFAEPLNDWHEVWRISDDEVAGAPARREAARQEAREATTRMREHRARGTGVFAPLPAGTAKDKWAQRRRHGIAKFLSKWEIAAAYAPLDASDQRDALWLLSWFDSPPRRFEAMRWFCRLRERDPAGATAVLLELEKDPDARGLALFLKNVRDHLYGLPYWGEVTDASLRPLANEQVHWIHRAAWALEGQWRFSDPAVAGYLAMLPGYTPMSDRRRQKLLSDPAFRKDPDRGLLHLDPVEPGRPADRRKPALEALRRAEEARGIGRPGL